MDNRPIGIFDSGVGGLTVLTELNRLLPNEYYIYFGDTGRVPYGEKTKEQLFAITRGIFEWFKEQNVKAVIMACNTSSAVVYETIKEEYEFPVFSLITPTADYVAYLGAETIGVIATSATVSSRAYTKEIKNNNPEIEVHEVACPGLVEIVENNKINTFEAKKLIVKYITPLLKKKAEKIILGCTHYPFLSDIINQITCDNKILVDPAGHLAQKVYDEMLLNDMISSSLQPSKQFFVSSNPELFIEAGKRFCIDCQGTKELIIPEVQNIKR